MNRRPRTHLALILTVAFGSTGLQAEEERSAREVRPSYSRQRVERDDLPEPETRALPSSLRIAAPRSEVAEPADAAETRGAGRTRRGPPDPRRNDDLRSRAGRAAAWAAEETIQRFGGPRYFEVGFHDGLHDAIRHTRHDRWELEQGRRAGLHDREALGLGEEIGAEEALLASGEEARRQVVEQFSDLSREPVRQSAPPPPPFTAAGFSVTPPRLDDVFRDLSWRGRRHPDLGHLRLDPWRLYNAGRHGDFYSHDWRTVGFGFELWRKSRRRAEWFRGLDGEGRSLFEEWFGLAFEAELARRFSGLAERSFDRGYDAGWRHGIRIGREWQYRRGYHLGFEEAVRETARVAFHVGFRRAWVTAYDDLFREWSTTVKLETRSARLRDGNDDGIFEPGEELVAELELVNVGGGSGRLEAGLAGAVLARADSQVIDLPRRSPVRRLALLRGAIRSTAAPMTDTSVRVSIGDFTETLPLRVSHVLRFEGGLRLAAHDALRGTAAVEVELANASRRAVSASLDADLRRGRLRRPRRDLTRIPAGAVRQVRFEIEGADPLDLVAGDLVLLVTTETGGRPQDRLEAALPELATDLDDDSLVDYLLWQGVSASADRSDIARAHELMLRRLEADWRAAIREDGNPYKQDLRNGSASTALGELVAAVRGGSGDRRVFADLVPRIDELSRSLPGSHPFLRRSMRKLGRQLL